MEDEPHATVPQTSESKKLIVYYSRSGNTEHIAEEMQKVLNCKMVKIEPKTEYSSWYGVAAVQCLTRGKDVEIKTEISDLENYDTLYLGTPTWWYTISPPVIAFLKKHKLVGKRVILFMTNEGGNGSSFEDTQNLCPESKVELGAVFRKDTKNGLQEFLDKIVND